MNPNEAACPDWEHSEPSLISRERSEGVSGAEPVPRGVSPKILLDQIRNTAPFLFAAGLPLGELIRPASHDLRYLKQIRNYAALLTVSSDLFLDHVEYFELCLCAHHATVATFVPTDVDNQIRFRLWHPSLPTETILKMANLVRESQNWDSRAVSARWVSDSSGRVLSGHSGEWFSTAVAAYGALRRRMAKEANELRERIVEEMAREASIFRQLREEGNGIGLLKAATLIAHNLGDLDRVIDLWGFQDDDPLKQDAYKAGHSELPRGSSRWGKMLVLAGEMNKEFMASENHRHFSLRGPRVLRRGADLLIGLGPFFDAWGAQVVAHDGISGPEVADVVHALVDGWDWLQRPKEGITPKPTFGYPRGLSGIIEAFPGGWGRLSRELPKRIARTLEGGLLRTLVTVPRARFDEQWNRTALKFASK